MILRFMFYVCVKPSIRISIIFSVPRAVLVHRGCRSEFVVGFGRILGVVYSGRYRDGIDFSRRASTLEFLGLLKRPAPCFDSPRATSEISLYSSTTYHALGLYTRTLTLVSFLSFFARSRFKIGLLGLRARVRNEVFLVVDVFIIRVRKTSSTNTRTTSTLRLFLG